MQQEGGVGRRRNRRGRGLSLAEDDGWEEDRRVEDRGGREGGARGDRDVGRLDRHGAGIEGKSSGRRGRREDQVDGKGGGHGERSRPWDYDEGGWWESRGEETWRGRGDGHGDGHEEWPRRSSRHDGAKGGGMAVVASGSGRGRGGSSMQQHGTSHQHLAAQHGGSERHGGVPEPEKDLSAMAKSLTHLVVSGTPPEDLAYSHLLTTIHNRLQRDSNKFLPQPKELSDLAFSLGRLPPARLGNLAEPLFNRIADLTKMQVEFLTTQDIASLGCGFVSFRLSNEALMSVLASLVVDKIKRFDQRELSAVAWSFAKAGLWNIHLVVSITGESVRKIKSFTPLSMATIVWALTQWAASKEENVLTAIAEELRLRSSEFCARSLSMVVWGFATLQHRDQQSGRLMQTVAVRAKELIKDFRREELGHVAWAFANLQAQDDELFNKIAKELRHQGVVDMQPVDLANTAWAFAKSHTLNEGLMHIIAIEASQQLHKWRPAEVSLLIWVFAVNGLRNVGLLTEMFNQIRNTVKKYSFVQLSHIAWGIGTLSIRHEPLLLCLSEQVREHYTTFKAQGLSNVVWAFATVCYRDEDLLKMIAPEITRNTGELRPLALARCAWAYSRLAVPVPELAEALAIEALKKVWGFPSKVMVALHDSIYRMPIAPVTHKGMDLRKVATERIESVAEYVRKTFPVEGGRQLDPAIYREQVQAFGLNDCGIVGTPMLLEKLGIEPPDAKFVRECFRQPWSEQAEGCASSTTEGAQPLADAAPRENLAAALLSLEHDDKTWEGWVVHRGPSDTNVDECDGDTAQPDQPHLLTCVLPPRTSAEEPVVAVLEEILSRAFSELSIEVSTEAAPCSEVSGSVKMFSTYLPCVSSVAAMWQFKVLFPKVIFEFVEQVGFIED